MMYNNNNFIQVPTIRKSTFKRLLQYYAIIYNRLQGGIVRKVIWSILSGDLDVFLLYFVWCDCLFVWNNVNFNYDASAWVMVSE